VDSGGAGLAGRSSGLFIQELTPFALTAKGISYARVLGVPAHLALGLGITAVVFTVRALRANGGIDSVLDAIILVPVEF